MKKILCSCSISDIQEQVAATQAEAVNLCRANEDLAGWLGGGGPPQR
jgi:hypothetical protein